jgi:hypothetical protein
LQLLLRASATAGVATTADAAADAAAVAVSSFCSAGLLSDRSLGDASSRLLVLYVVYCTVRICTALVCKRFASAHYRKQLLQCIMWTSNASMQPKSHVQDDADANKYLCDTTHIRKSSCFSSASQLPARFLISLVRFSLLVAAFTELRAVQSSQGSFAEAAAAAADDVLALLSCGKLCF